MAHTCVQAPTRSDCASANDRSKRRTQISQRCFHPCLSFGSALTPTEIGHEEVEESPKPEPFFALIEALLRASCDLTQPATYAAVHCTESLLLRAQSIVQERIALLDAPDQMFSQRYPTLGRLWLLHRTLMEALVVVRGVTGLLAQGLLHTDRTDSYNQLCEYIMVIQKSCREILTLLSTSVSELSAETEASAQLVAASA